MAETKEHKIVSASESGAKAKPSQKKTVEAAPVGNAAGLRGGAIALWVAGLGLEIVALLIALGKINLKFMPTLWQLIVMLVLDLACVIVGAQLWKKANHIKPASEKNKLLFWLWNNMGVIACVIDFLPVIIVLLANKDLDKKTKTIAVVVAIIALLIGGVASYDFNPVSEEQQQAAIAAINTDVYWAPFGKVYHTHEDCSALNHTDTLVMGTVEEAIAAGRTRLCSFCARKDDITGVATDGAAEVVDEVADKIADTAADTEAQTDAE